MKLRDKVAIVTGGGRGLGREIALVYAEAGANLVLVARTQSEIEAVGQEVKTLGRKALVIPTDVTVEEQVNRMVQKTVDEFGRVDILVNNAGGPFDSYRTMICDLNLADWRVVLDINVTGTFLCSRAVLRHMIQQKSGIIINISSGMGRRGRAGMGAYSAAKFAVEGLTQAMALELAPFNIRVNALQPGGMISTQTVLIQNRDVPREKMLQPRIMREVAVSLASDDSAGVTGQSFIATTWNIDCKDVRDLLEHRRKVSPAT